MKRCSKCGIEKPLNAFCHDRSRKDGHFPQCKECINEHSKEYYNLHKEEKKKYHKEYVKVHQIERKEYHKEYFKTPNGKLSHTYSNHNRRALYKNGRADMTPARWGKILRSQDNRCNICHKKFTKKRPATQDHITPISKNGSLLSDNIQALCLSCNSSKRAKVDRGYIQTWCA